MSVNIQLNSVAKHFGRVRAVDEVSFALSDAETVALVGHNGAGKTTLIKLMLGLSRPTSGSVTVLGQDTSAGNSAVRRHLGYLPENVSFNLVLTGREMLRFYVGLKGESPRSVNELMDRIGLAHAADRRIGTYSKGMRQRLGLAQALIGTPRVLLLDEPTTGLDPELRQQFYRIVREMRDAGTTILLSSHALNELEGNATRVIIMNEGKKIADGSLDELRRIARLPTVIRMRATDGGVQRIRDWMGNRPDLRQVNGHTIELDASPDSKIAFLRRTAGADVPFDDIEMVPPGLDELYAHFLGGRPSA
ncbi:MULTISPECIES: ABC transporter ATP-binding protein [unclassified Mesorhizobium]|uniref:ABC transporter ATP-binding protein n=1 Tax=unclassified Mesorhizobium TaxID=325217 RepID=UPI001093FCB2|nr:MULTISPECIES: ABC transporter ATP-binding protein [unclassified Mesorhizobium]TGQ72947.1 ABC transporter ATP-binding protein [bacterium M00.F.Ca.ET.205.01.1.1]TGU53703.1 ABC transporter ATP-binding protein [bacterium M00.F.Ca.ET.152.01.1.1]TGV37202.1 ABC transporter ATP-binding protein [Mesorhizobium sp. M00.F.Ca.ET.186.01.1.1]TGZ39429.1 ABC transporter ATP-binding protein [bacterium M00.F.Ca.ET.162.01.1.1]TGT92114.1 ABC transporter ATP-binding protein [Mesorhizobium sp. M8A.F.Ca.ET.161.01.